MNNKHLLLHESFKKALGLVEFCYTNPGSTLLLTGESGVGKTTVIQESLKRLEKSDTTQTILSVHVPVPFNLRVFLSSLLKGIGVPQYDKGTSNKKRKD